MTALTTRSIPPTWPSRSPPRWASRRSSRKRRPILLEPIVDITVYAPPEFIGDVTGDLNKRRGRIASIESDKVAAQVPLGELTKYATDLRSFTHGRGTYSFKFSHYEEVPAATQEKLMATYAKLKAEGELSKV